MKTKLTCITAVLAQLGLTNIAAAIVEEGDGYEAALVNFRFIANTVWTTEEAVKLINEAK